ncbi:MAG: hypothetical protein ACFCVK_20405 [Acidimicrobiales bacterium]
MAALGAATATILFGAVLAWLVAGAGALHVAGLVVFLGGHVGLIATLALVDGGAVDVPSDRELR